MSGQKRLFWAVLLAALTLGVLVWTNRAVTPKKATWEDVVAEARAGGYRLLTTRELEERLRKDPEGVFLVDTRQAWEYRTGHIPGAVNFPMEPTWWSRWRKKGALKTLLGPEKDRFIVFY